MTGSAGTPLPQKLGIKPGSAVAVLGAPSGFAASLALPDGARVGSRLRADLDVIILFVARVAELERRFAAAGASLTAAGGLWVAWPKQASGRKTDLTEDEVRRIGLAGGLVDNKVCAIDEVWSALRFVVRLGERAARVKEPLPAGAAASAPAPTPVPRPSATAPSRPSRSLDK